MSINNQKSPRAHFCCAVLIFISVLQNGCTWDHSVSYSLSLQTIQNAPCISTCPHLTDMIFIRPRGKPLTN